VIKEELVALTGDTLSAAILHIFHNPDDEATHEMWVDRSSPSALTILVLIFSLFWS